MPTHRTIERPATIDRPAKAARTRTFFGELVRTRLPAHATNGQLSIIDFIAPAGFGPPRHVRHREHEIFEVISGRCVVWTPSRCDVLAPGDLVLFPKDSPHTWRAYGDEVLHMTITVTPGGLERMFEDMAREGLDKDDLDTLNDIATRAELEVIGPPLSDEEVRAILIEVAAR